MRAVDRRTGIEVIEREECLRLLAAEDVGRVAVALGGAPLLLPVNYALLDGDVVFRTAEGSKLAAVRHGSLASFEIDGLDRGQRAGWSVVVNGTTEEVVDDGEVAALAALPLEPWAPSPKPHWVRLRTTTVSGRRIGPPSPGSG